uniref:Uncharacterized protein n=1 Tax=Anguilla anguilla TaxID=7936 RepID=A0A0E9TYQ6_ANGAN
MRISDNIHVFIFFSFSFFFISESVLCSIYNCS